MPKSVDTIIVVNPDGSISIAPNAIDLLAATNLVSPQADRRIAWHDITLSGSVIARIFGYKDVGTLAAAYVQAISGGGGLGSGLVADVTSGGKSRIIGQTDTDTTTRDWFIGESDGQSCFLQVKETLAGGQVAKSLVLNTSAFWPGGSTASNTTTINHNLGTLGATHALGQCTNQAGVGPSIVTIITNTANSLSFRLDTQGAFSPGGGTVSPVSFLIWGAA